MPTCACVSASACLCVCLCTGVFMDVHICVWCVSWCAYIGSCVPVCACLCARGYMCTHVCLCAHVPVCLCVGALGVLCCLLHTCMSVQKAPPSTWRLPASCRLLAGAERALSFPGGTSLPSYDVCLKKFRGYYWEGPHPQDRGQCAAGCSLGGVFLVGPWGHCSHPCARRSLRCSEPEGPRPFPHPHVLHIPMSSSACCARC